MFWVVLGTAAIVTAFVVVGMVVDRRVPLLPPVVSSVAGARALPSPVSSTPVAMGESAATAVKVPSEWRPRLAAGTCRCGKPLAVSSDEPVRFGGRQLVVVRLACGACGHGRSVYLEPAVVVSGS
jgi:hypothetical protein